MSWFFLPASFWRHAYGSSWATPWKRLAFKYKRPIHTTAANSSSTSSRPSPPTNWTSNVCNGGISDAEWAELVAAGPYIKADEIVDPIGNFVAQSTAMAADGGKFKMKWNAGFMSKFIGDKRNWYILGKLQWKSSFTETFSKFGKMIKVLLKFNN